MKSVKALLVLIAMVGLFVPAYSQDAPAAPSPEENFLKLMAENGYTVHVVLMNSDQWGLFVTIRDERHGEAIAEVCSPAPFWVVTVEIGQVVFQGVDPSFERAVQLVIEEQIRYLARNAALLPPAQ